MVARQRPFAFYHFGGKETPMPAFVTGLGWLIALLVLIICVVLMVIGHALTSVLVFGLIAAVAVSRLV